MEGLVSVGALMEHLKNEDLIIIPRVAYEQSLVDGLTIKAYKRKVLAQTWLTFSQISKAQLWGVLGQKAVYNIAVSQCDEHKLNKKNNTWRLHIVEVKRIMKLRGYE